MTNICLIGAGNMGGAMLAGWVAKGVDPATISVIDPKPNEAMAELMARHNIRAASSADDVARPDIVIVAVKPQMMSKVLPGLVDIVSGDTVVLSVAAGTTIAQLSAPFHEAVRIVRAMPNTPSMVGRGITVCVANDLVTAAQRGQITELLSAVGQVEWVDDEVMIDAVTGVSGSGPAYVFHLAEALAAAGEAAGLPAELAMKLASATVSGAGELMHQSDLGPAQLRENVMSPNGTTVAGLHELMGDKQLETLMVSAVAAAAKRSRELSKE